MAFWNEIGNRIAWLFRRSRFEREIEEEMRFHIQARADELEQAGLTAADAVRQARRVFGSTLRSREETRSAWQCVGSRTLAPISAMRRVRCGAIAP